MAWRVDSWTNGEEKITGRWIYNWYRDVFHISLDKHPKKPLRNLDFTVYDDSPEFGKFKLCSKLERENKNE